MDDYSVDQSSENNEQLTDKYIVTGKGPNEEEMN